MWQPSEEDLAKTVADYQGGFTDQMNSRVPNAQVLQIRGMLFSYLWRASGLMLIGMALFNLGFLDASLPSEPGVFRRHHVGSTASGNRSPGHSPTSAAWR